MALSREAYQALEDIVGPENISEEPAILDSYAFQWKAEMVAPDKGKFQTRPEAVILPGSTEEVQAIVRACNRYKMKYKAFSTGWTTPALPTSEGVIQLDLRRMDRILEIDEENMFAVVEPYVIGATLQAEAMKLGLNTHIIGAGTGCSPLAAATSFIGHGPDSIFMGHASENLLAVEWVMPTGDIMRTGSLGSRAGWFCGEGPGPSVRGIIRGVSGAAGDMGVFTKCALKLSPWPGPPVMPVQGTTPSYNSPLPENFRSYTMAFPTWQALADASYKIWESEIAYICHRQFNMLGEDLAPAFFMMYIDPTKTLDDLEELVKRPDIQKLTEEMKRSFQIVLAGNSPRDIEYKEKVLSEILAETGGKNVAAMATPEMQRFTLMYLIKMGYKNLNSVYSGSFFGTFMQLGTPDFMIKYIPVAEEALKRHQQTGLLVDSGADSMMGCIGAMGDGTYCVQEQFFFWDPHDKESVGEAVAYAEDAHRTAIERGWPPGMETIALRPRMSKEERQSLDAMIPQPIILQWQRKIKEALDPNDTSEGRAYVTMEKEPRK